MEATSTTAKKKTMIKPSPSLSHMSRRWQALLPLGMLAVYKETSHLLTWFQNEPAKPRTPCELFSCVQQRPHSRPGYRCLKNFLWKARFMTCTGTTLPKHFLLASVWGRGPQHSSPVRRYNEVRGLAGSEDENILSEQLPYSHSVKSNHHGRRPFPAKSSEQHERRRREEETARCVTSLKIAHITCWLLGFATRISQDLSIHSAAVSLWTTIFQGAIWFLRQM